MPEVQRDSTNFDFYQLEAREDNSREELISGLIQKNKAISPKYFYDKQGSSLFEQITREPEYYPTRTEKAILKDKGQLIANWVDEGCTLIEPGSGNSEKVRLLLEHFQPDCYVPLDISKEHLYQASAQLALEYTSLDVRAVCTDYTQGITLPSSIPTQQRVAFYPGSTIGNFSPEIAQVFLKQLRQMVGDDGGLIIGVDLQKAPDILHAAYNDANGTTAAFNLNILNNVNSILQSDFNTDNFSHEAFYNSDENRVEMHLVSQSDQEVNLNAHKIRLEEGERINTEHSYKYTVEQFSTLAQRAGFAGRDVWMDNQALFSVHYLDAV